MSDRGESFYQSTEEEKINTLLAHIELVESKMELQSVKLASLETDLKALGLMNLTLARLVLSTKTDDAEGINSSVAALKNLNRVISPGSKEDAEN